MNRQTVNRYCFVFLAAVGIGSVPANAAESYLASVGSGLDTIPVAVVRGTPYEMGRAYGRIDASKMIDLACQIPIRGGNLLDVVYDAMALEFWVAYAEKDSEAYRRPFVHVRLKDYLDTK